MGPPSTGPNEFTFPMNQTALHSNEHSPSDLEGSTTGVDRKTKKRIQNRVAQRTYRTRIKQRLQDLQQQVHQLQQKEGEKPHDIQGCEIEADGSGNGGETFYTSFAPNPILPPIHNQNRDPFSVEATSQDITGIKSTDSGPWVGIPSQSILWNPPLGGTNFIYNTTPMRTRPPIDLASGAAVQSLSPIRLPSDLSSSALGSQASHGESPLETLAFSRANEDNSQGHIHSRTENIYDGNEQTSHFRGFNSPYTSPWGHKLEPKAPADDSIAASHIPRTPQATFHQDRFTTTPPVTTPSQAQGNWLSNQQATMEQQFEYVLSCAQRAGFDSFDTMALHYYTRNFNPSSALALEQRLSRNRRLPELLAELRKQSTNWSTLQRRGYQDEILKAAEEICAMEYNVFHTAESSNSEDESVSETALGDMLPNLWALLTGLVSSNHQLSQRQISEVVYMSMRILCGLQGTQNQTTGSSTSRQSPR
ncbi:hypothetical protein F4678DRAFT_320588 [Xylaria arbuscula]|nr:hypothetical protein F4678DRAFT_320588 [Xylaria arbuscula]